MQKNLEGLSIGSHDDKIRDASVEGLGGLVGALLKLLVVGSLLHKIQDGHGQLGIREGVCLRVDFAHF